MKKFVCLLVALFLPLTACAVPEQEDEYAAVCIDPETETRLPDDACEQGDSDFLAYAVLWYMLAGNNNHVPGIGHKVKKSHFKTTKPKNATFTTAPSKGTTYKKPSSSYNDSGTKTKTKSSGGGSKSGGFGGGSRKR